MTLRRYTAAVVLSTTLVFINPAAVNAGTVTTSTITASISDVSISSSKIESSGGNVRFAQVLSSNYNRTVSPMEIIRLRSDFDFGLGEISLIYAAAVYSGRSVDEISHHRYENMGWGEIAKLYGIKVKDIKKSNEDVVIAARERGVDITYIEIDNERDYDHHAQDDKNDYKKNKKPDNSKGQGHKR